MIKDERPRAKDSLTSEEHSPSLQHLHHLKLNKDDFWSFQFNGFVLIEYSFAPQHQRKPYLP